jgi:hypothetical protein
MARPKAKKKPVVAKKKPVVAKKKPAKTPAKKPAKKPKAAPPPISSDFRTLVEVFLERPGVTQALMMGCHGLRLANKYFAMEWDGQLVVKLPRETVDSFADAGRGTRFDPGMGRPMKEWLTVPPGVADWRYLAEQAFSFVSASL